MQHKATKPLPKRSHLLNKPSRLWSWARCGGPNLRFNKSGLFFIFIFFKSVGINLQTGIFTWKVKKKQKKKNITFSAQELFSSKALNNCNSMYGIGNLASNFLFSAIQDGDFHKKNSWLYWTAVILHLPIKFPQMYAFLRKCHRKRTQEKNWLTRCDYQAQRVIAKKAR